MCQIHQYFWVRHKKFIVGSHLNFNMHLYIYSIYYVLNVVYMNILLHMYICLYITNTKYILYTIWHKDMLDIILNIYVFICYNVFNLLQCAIYHIFLKYIVSWYMLYIFLHIYSYICVPFSSYFFCLYLNILKVGWWT